jgi:hypothetical protein
VAASDRSFEEEEEEAGDYNVLHESWPFKAL